jgi:hypothetical protein
VVGGEHHVAPTRARPHPARAVRAGTGGQGAAAVTVTVRAGEVELRTQLVEPGGHRLQVLAQLGGRLRVQPTGRATRAQRRHPTGIPTTRLRHLLRHLLGHPRRPRLSRRRFTPAGLTGHRRRNHIGLGGIGLRTRIDCVRHRLALADADPGIQRRQRCAEQAADLGRATVQPSGCAVGDDLGAGPGWVRPCS